MSSGDIRQTTVPTQSAKLEVKPLPKEGRPEDFSGAIGQFSLQASATPKQAAAGDPISLNVTVSGRGNFDAMASPTLLEADGWRTYPPGEKFEASPSDPIGFNGEKRFEYMLVAREDRSQTPVAQLSFFDPSLEKYVTIKSSAIEVAAKGTADPAAVAAATPAPQPQPTPASVSTPIQKESLLASNFSPGILHVFRSRSPVPRSEWCFGHRLVGCADARLRACGSCLFLREGIRRATGQPQTSSQDERSRMRSGTILPYGRGICAFAAYVQRFALRCARIAREFECKR